MVQYEYQFSVIIPYYNLPKELDRCLKSLSLQLISKKYFEILVVDDGSSINAINIVNKYYKKLPNLTFFQLKKNKGPGIARNFGINKSKGKYIIFLDCDDILTKDAIKKLNTIARKNYDAISFNFSYLNSNTKFLKRQRKDQTILNVSKNKLLKLFLSMNYHNAVTFTVCKKDIFLKQKIKFPHGYHEDIPVLLQMYYFSKYIYFKDQILYLKKNRENSIVNSYSFKRINDYFQSWTLMKEITIQIKGVKFFKKYLIKYYISGIMGLIAIIIKQNIEKNQNNIVLRNNFYRYICKSIKNQYLQDLDNKKLPNKSKYDQISNYFFQNYFYEKKKNIKCLTIYEKKLYNKNLI